MKMRRLALVGAGGHGKVIADTALLAGWYEILFFDDLWPKLTSLGPWKVIGNTRKLFELEDNIDGALVAIGNNITRLSKQSELEKAKINIVKIVHPAAIISSFSEVGDGSVVFAGAVINAFTKIGRGCIINTSSSIDHDCILEDGVHISPGAHIGGGVFIGTSTWIGIGASVIQGITLGDNVIVGAGAAVVSDIEPDVTVVGVPAHVVNKK